MGKSTNSHGKKSDKETQSPMLKIFRDIMQRENADPEKAKLLKEKRKKKKKTKQYPWSKSDLAKSGDSSANEQNHGSKAQFTVHQQRNREYGPCRKASSFGTSEDKNQVQTDESCSCVSCALKRIVSNEYACIGCLLCLFTISVIFAFLLISTTIPTKLEKVDDPDLNDVSRIKGKVDSDSMKKTIEMLSEKRGDFGSSMRGRRADDARSVWEDSLLKQLGELGSLSDNSETDYGDSSLRETNGQVDSDGRASGAFKIVLDANEIKNEQLKGFYKKLIETDAKIKNLKKGFFTKSTTSPFVFKNMPGVFTDRIKRSLFHRKPRIKVTVKNLNGSDFRKNPKHNLRNRRFENGSLIPSGFLFEKKRIFVQYMPMEKKIYPKCSHVPKDSKSHENEQKHPFYKNTERLDEMLDQLLDKSFPEILRYDPRSEIKKKCHHETVQPKSPLQYVYDTTDKVYDKFVKPNVSRAKKIKGELMKILQTEAGTLSTEDPRYHTTRYHISGAHSTHTRKDETRETPVVVPTENYDLVLSISTLINPTGRRATKLAPEVLLLKNPGRKLQQFEEDVEEGIGYDDVKEVLSDDMATHDDTDRQVERKKRDGLQFDTDKPVPPRKYNPPGVHNPNWKGPMPLYPDELSTMMKHDDTNKDTEIPAKTQLLVNNETELQWLTSKTDGLDEGQESDEEDVQYIEDYTKNKYDKLVQMAQAYSDYGVLDLKKEQNEKNQITKEKEHRIKLAADDQNLFERGFFRRPKKGSESEGIRCEIKHNAPKDDSPIAFFKSLSKHIKITNVNRNDDTHCCHTTTLLPVFTSDLTLLYLSDNSETTKKTEMKSDEPHTHFNLGPLKRHGNVDQDPYNKQNFTEKIKNKDDIKTNFKRRSLKSIDLNFDYNGGNLFQVSQDNYVEKHKFQSKARLKRNIKYIDTDIDKIITDDSLKLFSELDDVPISETIDTEESKTQNVSLNDMIKVSNCTEAVKVTDSKVINDTENINVDVKENKANNPLMEPSEFFSVISNWFSTLSGLSNETGTLKGVSSNISNSSINVNENKHRSTTEKTSKYLEYPMYDSDMVDNIGHRSRVLLSIQENVNNSEVKALGLTKMEAANAGGEKTTYDLITVTVKTYCTTRKLTTKPTNINAKTDKDANTKTNEKIRDSSNKTLVKRNAEDSKLIFWNDMYDEEYGIQEHLENTMGDKRTLEKTWKKSGTWLHDKIKKLTGSMIKSSRDEQKEINPKLKKKSLLSRFGITIKPNKMGGSEKPEHKIVKRDDEVDEYETDEDHRPSQDKEINFTLLNNHMKQVLKEAAAAVKKTRNLEVREDSMTGTVTSELMQQLVKLMSDLVDFQVQQKTCLQLPNDLKNFLAWLTNKPDSGHVISEKPDVKLEIEDYVVPHWTEETVATPSSGSETESLESRAECLRIQEAVRDLMQQYNAMGEEEKSKMMDIKEYLDNQLDFLNKKLAKLDQDNLATLYANDMPLRYRRDITTSKYDEKPTMYLHRHRGKRRHRRRLKRKLNRFLRNYGKKHTKTTATYVEFLVSTDVIGKKRDNVEKVEVADDETFKREIKKEDESEKTKRNLIDVYYRALADAKKVSTEKVAHKKDFEVFEDSKLNIQGKHG